MDTPLTIPPVAAGIAHAILAAEITSTADPATVARAIDGAMQRLRELVTPLVGAAGFSVLVGRAARLCAGEYTWMMTAPGLGAPVLPTATPGMLRADLESLVVREGRDRVIAGAACLLGQVLGLLCRFIGEDVTVRLVRSVWTDLPGRAARDEEEP